MLSLCILEVNMKKSGQTWMVFWWKDTLEESRISQFPSDLSQDNIALIGDVK